MFVWYVVIVLSIIVLCGNMLLNISIFYNANKNLGDIVIKIWRIPILKANIEIKQNIVIINKKNKKIKINLKLSKRQLRILKELRKNISTKILINTIDFDLLLCMEDPFFCSILSNVIDIFANILFSRMLIRNSDSIVSKRVNTGFRHDMITIKFDSSMYISVIDILWAVVATLLTERRYENEERRRKTEL